MTSAPDMLKAALWYARRGFHVFPCHEPLFDDPHGYVCTCEPWRHSDDCKRKRPDLYLNSHQHCDRPGKHPRGVMHGKDDATTDEAQIRTWWGKYPTANIGCVPGRNGYAVLDADAYKEVFAGADMLTLAEQETPTALTGGGGSHLWYRKHEGATYSNAPGTLPAGVDVRADGGYVLLPPSLHKSGSRYAWELGYGPHEIEAQTLPQRIHDILTAATAAGSKRKATFTGAAKWDGEPTTRPPALDTWRLSADVRQLIANGAPKGNRSESDMKVCVALVRAGASDDDILAVFEHHPIGRNGKFAEGGRRYLERTAGRARDFADSHPPPAPIGPLIAALRDWLHGIDLAAFVPDEKQCANGYRTRERDLAVADAILEVFDGYGKTSGPLGLRQLRKMANLGGLATAARALECLTPWFVRPVETDGGAGDAANAYELAPELVTMAGELVRTWNTKHIGGVYPGVPSTHKTFTDYRAHDAFNATTTPITPAMVEERAAAGCPYSVKYTLTAIYRRRLTAALPGAGRTALVIVDALADAGGGLALADLVGMGGRSRFTIGRAVGRLEDLHLVTVDAGAVQLRPDWQEWLQNIVELMPTHGNGRRRIVRDALATIQSCADREAQAKESGAAAPDWCARRRERAERELQRLAPGARRAHVWQRWDRQEMNRECVMLAADLAAMGGSRADKLRMATMAGWTPEEVMQALRPSVLAQLPQLAAGD